MAATATCTSSLFYGPRLLPLSGRRSSPELFILVRCFRLYTFVLWLPVGNEGETVALWRGPGWGPVTAVVI
ncbi:unnamed protein product [Sphagnum jensenii]